MKVLKYFYVILIAIFSFNLNVLAASSKFDATINLIPEITNDEITLIVGYTGEEIMAVFNNVSWDSNYLNLVTVSPLTEYNVTNNNPVIDGKYNTIKIVADSDYSYTDSNYAVIVFELTDKFLVGEETDVVFYNYEAAGVDIYKYKHKGYILTLKRDSRTNMVSFQNAITDKTKIEYWFRENWLLVVFGILVFIAIIVLILVMPTKRRKENRDKKVREQTKDKDYNYGKNNYKIDHDKLDKIAGINQDKDMSEAIIISDLNPFQSAEGTARTVAGQEKVINSQPMGSVTLPPQVEAPVVNAGVQLMDNIPVNNNPENLAQVYIPDQVLAPGQSEVQAPVNAGMVTLPPEAPVQQAPVQNVGTDEFNVGFDPFNMKLETPQVQESVQQVPVENVQSQVSPVQAVPNVPVQESELFQEIEDTPQTTNTNNDNLVLFQPQNFESAHKSSDIETLVLAILFLISALVLPSSVTALNYEVEELRACIVGNIPFDIKYDYNDDGKVDVIDIVTTKDLNNVTMEQVGETHPGYITIEEQGFTTTRRPGYKAPTTERTSSTHPGFKTTTKNSGGNIDITIGDDDNTTTTNQIIIGGETTNRVTNKTTSRNTTTKNTTTKNSGSTNKTTTRRTTTTTTKKSTTRRTTTTTTKKTTTKTTAGNKSYEVIFRATYGVVATNKVTVEEGKSASTKVTPNAGYEYASVSCTNGEDVTYNTSNNTMTVYGVNAATTCKVVFKVKSYKVNFSITGNGVNEEKSVTVEHGKAASMSFDGTYYDVVSKSCNKHTPVFESGKFKVASVTASDYCEMQVKPKMFTVTINNASGSKVSGFTTNYTTSAVTQTFVASGTYSYIKCGSSNVKLTKSGNNYTFKYQVKSNVTCTVS